VRGTERSSFRGGGTIDPQNPLSILAEQFEPNDLRVGRELLTDYAFGGSAGAAIVREEQLLDTRIGHRSTEIHAKLKRRSLEGSRE
jgi:hypothetical protein